MRAAICVSLVSVAVPTVAAEEIYPGYRWQAVGSGIFVHSQTDPLAGPVDGNSTVIIADDAVVVVDTHINPAVTRAVINKIRRLTDSPVTHVVNTHWHDDHVNGNHEFRKAFPEVAIIAHRATLHELCYEWQVMEEQRSEAYAGVDVEELRKKAADEEQAEPGSAIAYSVYAGYVAALRPELPTLVLEYPDTVFDDSISLAFGDRRIEIRWPGRGNTDGDAVVWLPTERVLVTGDLLVAPIPFAFDAPMKHWSRTLERLAELEPGILIPGHGPVQYGDSYLTAVITLLDETLEQVRSARANGSDFATLNSALDLGAFRRQFAGDDPQWQWAWDNFYVRPGLKSAWQSLGYPQPDE